MSTLIPTSPRINNKVPSIRKKSEDPTVAHDTIAGYGKGSIWLNTTSKAVFVLTDNAAGAASWDEITETSTGQLPLTGGAMVGPITTTSTFDGVDVATRDTILTSTTSTADSAAAAATTANTTANAALPKTGGTMAGGIGLGGYTLSGGYLSSMTLYSSLDAYGYTITGLGDGSSSGDAVNYSQFSSLESRVATLESA